MMLENYLIKGLLIGIIFGVPAGVIGALTIKRTLSHGTFAGLASGLGCSAADLLYSCVSIFGLTLISDFMLKYQNIISVAGGIFIIVMGLGIMLKKQTAASETASTSRIISFFASSFIIAITNPATILTFLLAFSVFNVETVGSMVQGIQLAAGIFLGACLWWFSIVAIVRLFKKHITDIWLNRINHILGALIVLLGISVAYSSIDMNTFLESLGLMD